MTTEHQTRFQEDILEWGETHYRDFPWREPDRSLYEVFIAEFLLTQTPAENVASVYPRFIDQYPSLKHVRQTSEQELIELIEPLGFYNMRASALKRIAASNEILPESPSDLTELPRVGEYVANATLCFTRGDPLPILDRNVRRIYRRVFQDRWPESSGDQREFAIQMIPEQEARSYNLALLDFGAAVCMSDPSCESCFATTYCDYYQNCE
ncbi:hypothetical protein DVK02_12950 [Halobellus sp. Atlit-31R]|nr:hypothetical protein DVK02_12950 [Halobellus sp. Atlit-31R]